MFVHPGSFLLLPDTNFSLPKQGILPSSSASRLLLPCSRAQSKCPHTQLSFCEIFAHLPLPNKNKDACLLFGPRAASQFLVTYTLGTDEGDAQCVPLHLKSYVSPHPSIPPAAAFCFLPLPWSPHTLRTGFTTCGECMGKNMESVASRHVTSVQQGQGCRRTTHQQRAGPRLPETCCLCRQASLCPLSGCYFCLSLAACTLHTLLFSAFKLDSGSFLCHLS